MAWLQSPEFFLHGMYDRLKRLVAWPFLQNTWHVYRTSRVYQVKLNVSQEKTRFTSSSCKPSSAEQACNLRLREVGGHQSQDNTFMAIQDHSAHSAKSRPYQFSHWSHINFQIEGQIQIIYLISSQFKHCLCQYCLHQHCIHRQHCK